MRARLLVPMLTSCHCILLATCSAAISQSTNDVYLAVAGWRAGYGPVPNEPIRFDDQLTFLAFCDTGQVELVYPLDTRYGMRIRMFDARGVEVAKTRKGESVGSRFDELRDFKDTRTGVMVAWGSYKENPGLGGGKALPTPNALFKLKKPGIYTMEIEMQMFLVLKRTNQWSRKLFRFSPVRVAVEKPSD
jgi:hypothetical protein